MRRPIIVTLVLIAFVGTLATVAAVTAATTVPTQVPATPRMRPIATVAGAGGSAQTTSQAAGFAVVTPSANSVAPLGLPAITPKVVSNSPSVAAFVESDVRAYFTNHQLLGATTNNPITVQSVEFLTTDAVNRRLNTTVDQPTAKLLCLVKLSGDFVPHGPPGSSPAHETTAYVIFDARTGNLLTEIG